MLSAGPTPVTALEDWDFTIVDEAGATAARWTWEEFRALPSETPTVDIHCVTSWSKLATSWEGVSVDTLLEDVETSAEFVLAFCDGDYTTNLPLEDVTDGRAWVAWGYDPGRPRGLGRVGRIDQRLLAEVAWPVESAGQTFICGPTSFVEAVATNLVGLGHPAAAIRTERFGATGAP